MSFQPRFSTNIVKPITIAIALFSAACSSDSVTSENAPASDNFTMIHSAWLGGFQWQGVQEQVLKQQSATFNTPDMPGHGADKTKPADITFEDYVKTVTDILDKQDDKTILVGHSFGGMIASQVAEARPDKISALVYLCAFMLPDGVSFMDATQGVQGSAVLDNLFFNEDKTAVGIKESEIHHAFAHDLPAEAVEGAKAAMVMEPTAPLTYKLSLTEENYGSIPRYYVKCSEDNAIPPAVQDAMIQGQPVKGTFTLDSSHAVIFSDPKGVADALVAVADAERNE
ncbi:alpha/beta fold hydrolase [Grimontia sp. NTOU-MAR1]|uniref:alpha/beta fold hydrolase n=1 Tax=Grimontia sp. NTOU-MAR1 TaxID=3111011 RepID=UPI002DBF6EB5|nr:alpha/beta fold hydrolase [Grimontia sp. NTOU-MAR1]WRV96277.1 alpha/beta fold hydrolase [Grimontia sp. NTOU-MAR1]